MRAERTAMLIALALLAPVALAAREPAADVELIEFLGGTDARGKEPDPQWLLEEMSRNEAQQPAPAPKPVKPEVKP
jgi:hypothetical protein